jgi:gliding motility-associated-like protein
MKKLTQLLLIAITLLLGTFSAKATHIVGGEIYYDSLGNNQYKITFEIYRDCSSFTDYDNPLEYTIFYGSGGIWSQFAVTIFSRDTLPIVYDDPCVTPPNDICIERAIYIDTVTLPFDVSGYYISYQRCCWATNIENIVDPGGNGITLTNFIPGSDLVDVHNQAARFVNYPPLVLCANNTLTFDHAAYDPDGDSLAYALVAPYLGGDAGSVTPNPETEPPYTDVTWQPGFSETVPFGAGSSVTIDPETGMMDFTPNLIGNYVAGVEVREYRDGVLIHSKARTFGYRVVGCQVQIPLEVDITGPTELVEDCGFAGFIVSRTDATEELIVQVLLNGTATNGTDYNYIPDTLIIPIGVYSDTIGIEAVLDSLTEGNETVGFNIIIENPCDETYDTTSISLNIADYIFMTLQTTDSLNVCADLGESTYLFANVQNGAPPYVYVWTPTLPNSDTVIISPSMLAPNVNPFTVVIGDNCGKAIASDVILVYNQCPLIVPNVITVNGDGINDALIITNLEDFDKVSLRVFNRWGNLLYENSAYQNDWKGTDSNGNRLSEGVYFYLVTPTSEKYIYDDQEQTQYTLHGFFHLID